MPEKIPEKGKKTDPKLKVEILHLRDNICKITIIKILNEYSVVSIIRHVSIISTVWKKLQMTLLNVQYDLMLKRSYFLILVLFTS